jgi:hypothetical protein
MHTVTYGDIRETNPAEVGEFYRRLSHDIHAQSHQIRHMMEHSAAFVTARSADGRLIGIARGVSDGVRGYLAECKLDPAFQGPAAVTRTDGRVEHDQHGIAAEMARRVLENLTFSGVQRVDVLAYGTEEDFLEELGFKRSPGLVAMSMRPGEESSRFRADAAAMA